MTGTPFLRVDRGAPDPEELAAVTVAVLALLRVDEPAPAAAPTWSLPPYHAPGAWNQYSR
ncbi:hypothetical protein ALI22I_16150 [Saccharothrix sp. ALI-22-I]|uniref:acyl-CoA carboxylase subunit epsilon n=1 Tax=Saccharothrix sp. ALI-22-I TaxID=1933778 RepID=UPI00097C9D92|nr:acyl-CoA carboxylase subunit epsilon [Saccharothrix sp. ALI-22-I]ONI89534.1 hypothetical protein ALI22I_16150 [Saccharothrix sp. ALI-22-I]